MVLVRPPPFDDHVMMDGVPTSVHFDLTQHHVPCLIRGLVEVYEPSFHSPTFDSLSRAVWVIVDDGTPEENRQREKIQSSEGRYQRPDSSSWCVCSGVLEQRPGGALLFSGSILSNITKAI